MRWYNAERWEAIYPYICGERFSRRFIEHFITEYARSHRCEYTLKDPETGDVYLFNVYHAAQTVLAGVHKRHMDPFGRKNRDADENGKFEFGFGDKKAEVSVCSLVFFRWAHKHNVMQYAEEHEADIKADMKALSKLKRDKKAAATVRQIEIAVPDTIQQAVATAVHPLQDEYWKASLEERMQQPKKKRKRYRESAVDMVMTANCELKTAL